MGAEKVRTEEEYAIAVKIIRLLIDNGLIPSESGIDQYMKDWNLVFKILDLAKEE